MDPIETFRLTDRVAVIPGGSGGIGSAMSEAFAGAGAKVVVVGRTLETAEAAVERVRAAGSDGLAIAADVTDEAEVERVVGATIERFGRIDILVNAVGGGAGEVLHPAEEYPEDAWDWIMDINLRSAYLTSREAARAMIAGGRGGRILNISSVRGQLGIRSGFTAYVAAKGGLNALTRQHATEWAKYAITVNAISPTFVRTEQVASILADDAFREGLLARIPLNRIAETDDLVGATLFFCSDASSFVTGQVLTLDGGLTACQ
jgi:gluconate 5-dehydrogenase